MIIALAGRRIDSPDALKPRFPLANVELVRGRIHSLFAQEHIMALVCSAANGADLLALEVAGELQISRHIILPFCAKVFRETSVIDRPGGWGERFDNITGGLGAKEQLVSLNYSVGNRTAFLQTNQKIVKRARGLASALHDTACAVVVWNGASAGQHDLTLEFRNTAIKDALPIHDVLTV